MLLSSQNKSIEDFLSRFLTRVPGLDAVVVSDRDGVPLVQAVAEGSSVPADIQQLAVTFAVSADQASKLNMGPNKSITSFYQDRIIVQLNHLPLVITFVGQGTTLNIGVIHSLAPDVCNALNGLRSAVENVQFED
eukprot:TRINITY_DN1272_c0_g1_i1.p2 TRINITY_DN1272_c0_g1~~TRINITY_DN1272_c0_g1_i1.p2  ORF type:complete len:135 (+),score=21.66 TRINITY_DN1272_c0_g1_i1:624-1028(+)